MITEQQREARKKFIGSSDAAAILGVDPYKSAADVWLIKTGRADDFEGNEATDRGNYLESAILNFAEHRLGVKLERDVFLSAGPRCANLDARALSIPAVIEGKSTVDDEGWGEEGTDQVPHRVNVQVHHQLHVAGTDYRIAYVPVVMPGFKKFDFRMYVIERNDSIADMIAAECERFYEMFVKTDSRPDDYRPSLEVLKRIRREPNKVIDIPDELADALVVAKAVSKRSDEEVEAAQAAILAAMGDAEAARYSNGTLTYLEQHRKAYEVKATTFRVLRMKAMKGQKLETAMSA